MKYTALYVTLLILISCLTISCSDKLDIQQAYEFNVTTMPVQSRIKKGETVEIRCQLNRAGKYVETKYHLSYFQSDGRGELRMDDGTVLVQNDRYMLPRNIFRLYYTSHSSEQEQIDITFYDNFGQKFDLSFSFNDEKP